MKSVIIFALLLLHIEFLAAQNVGIGTATPQDRLDVNGTVRSTGLRIPNNGSIDLGFGIAGKETNAGRIGYGLFTANTVDFVGGGTNPGDRQIRFWAEGGANFTGGATFLANVGIGAAPGNSRLQLQSSNSGLLSLQNSNALNTGVSAALTFGGSNYTTAIVQTIGTSTNAARLGFSTGYSFSGGINNLQERLTIANNGFVGINNTNPQNTLHVTGTIRSSALAGSESRPVFADAEGDLTFSGVTQTIALNAADFMPVPRTASSFYRVDRSIIGGELWYFGDNSLSYGYGYFTYPITLPANAKIRKVEVRYRSKKPENEQNVTALKSKIGVTLYGQGIDPTFGGISIKAPLVTASDYSVSTSSWGVAGGGPAVYATTVENNTTNGFTTISGGITYSLIVWAIQLDASGIPWSTSDYINYSGWPSNGGLMFHSILVTYSFD